MRQGIVAQYLVEARLPGSDVVHGDPLLARLVADGLGRCTPSTASRRLVVDPTTYQVLNGAGRRHPHRIALGGFATSGGLGSFARPGTDAPFFRQNDRLARWILTELSTRRAPLPERVGDGAQCAIRVPAGQKA